MKKLVFLLLGLLSASIASAQLYRLENNQKLGFNAIILDNATISVTQISTNKEAVQSSTYNGGSFFYERIIKSQFGFLVGAGTLRRNVESRILSVDSSIEEQVLLFKLAGRSYFKRHRTKGFNLQVGADITYFQIDSKFIIATQELDGKKSKTNLFAYGLFTGFDWLAKNAGVRFNLGYIFGGNADNNEINDFHIQYDFNSLYVEFGTFAYF